MTDDSFRYLAYYHICFALASLIGNAPLRHSGHHTGEAYFVSAGVQSDLMLANSSFFLARNVRKCLLETLWTLFASQ